MSKSRRITNGIDVDKLDQEILDLGVRAKVFRSSLCPNMKSLESVDHDINCSVCRNNMIDFDPFETVLLFQQQSLNQQFTVQGTFHIDEVMVSFPSGVTLASFSKIELLDFKEDFYELVQRQEGTDVDRLKYAACNVEGLFTIDKTTNCKVRYHEGTDFKLNIDGNVEWLGAHRPADRQVYTIYYKYHPVYRAVKAIHRDRFSQYNLKIDKIKAPKTTVNGKTYVKLPEQWILQREYILEERGQNTYYDANE